MPTFTIISCALAVVYNGGVPVLVDCDPRTWCMDVDQVKGRLRADSRYYAGAYIWTPVDMDPILD